ncbi:PriCT-2 domain-containing protein [Aestuariivirga sp.]|jgi:hypothetical protein|uniref:PriCT-2 domain-containing protein n=1 Tax=Aestuariivirga sp. TaxID=2650926 RepID=UPI00378451A2
MKTENFMARYGERLLTNGYSILPIAPGTKKPGRHARGKWSDYPEWNRHAARSTTEIELKSWSRWPGCGIGIVGGAVAAMDIDIAEDPALALEIEKLARERLGDTSAVRIGRAPKRMLVYRTASPFKGIKRHPLEVLCLGQQFVAYAVHPDTGEPYSWPEEGLADIDIASLPEIDEDMARAFLEEASALLPEGMRHVTLAGGGPAAIAPSHAQAGTMSAIRAALAFIPNAELDYDSWVRIGLALKGAVGDAGEELFASWSAQAAKNDDAFTARNWASFKPNTIGAGTIYHLAMERGWKPDAGLVLDGTATKAEKHPATALLEKISAGAGGAAQASDTPRLVIPPVPALDRLDGALGLLVNHILVTAIRPQPWLAVGAALAALGSLMGRKVRTESNLRSNIYVLGIAESGGGKDHARKVIKEVFVQGGLAAHLGGERLASGAGLITALSRQPASLFQIDEFGKFVANVVDKRRAPKHLTEIWDLFTELATSAGTTFFGAEYADQRERPRQDIIEPCACIHGVTAPGPFWEALNSGALQDGSLARFLIFRSEEGIPDRNRQPGTATDLPVDLMDAILAVAGVGVKGAGNLAATGAPSTRPESLVVPMDEEARAIFDELDDHMTMRQRAAIGTDQGAVLARVWENAAKVALIKAVSANPAAPVIRRVDAVWARELVEHCAATLLVQAERHLANNDMERYHKQVLEFVREAGKEGIRHNELTRKCQFIDPKLRRDIIEALVEGEQIRSELLRNHGRRAILYRVRQGNSSNVNKASNDE